MQRIEELIGKIETMADPEARTAAVELVQSLMDFHGSGIERMMELVAEAGEAGSAIFESFARDSLVGSLLLLYGLHPVDVETRVMQALDKARPLLDSHGGDVELLGVDEGVVRLRFRGSRKGCPSSALTLKLTIEEAIYAVAPDITAIESEGLVEQPSPTGLVQLSRLRGRDEHPQPATTNHPLAAR